MSQFLFGYKGDELGHYNRFGQYTSFSNGGSPGTPSGGGRPTTAQPCASCGDDFGGGGVLDYFKQGWDGLMQSFQMGMNAGVGDMPELPSYATPSKSAVKIAGTAPDYNKYLPYIGIGFLAVLLWKNR